MNRRHGLRPLAVSLCLLLALPGLSAPAFAQESAAVAAPSTQARARQLAADVAEFATSSGLSRAKREKRIATAVRTAVVAATAYGRNRGDVVGAVSELAAAASRAAPAYAEVIANAAALAPSVARVDGASARIRSAAFAAARGGPTRRSARAATSPRSREHTSAPRELSASPDSDMDSVAAETPAPRSRTRRAPVESEMDSSDSLPAPEASASRSRRRGTELDEHMAFTFTTDVGARHEDNVFLSEKDKVDDTVLSVTPGLGFRWGGNALTHGNLDYRHSFNRYTQHTSDNVSLGSGSFNFGYDGAASSAALAASFTQYNQSNSDLQAAGQSRLVRSDLFGASGNFEKALGAKTGVKVGANYDQVRYPDSALIGNRHLILPVDLFYRLTAKTDLSLGYSYGTQRPDGDGPHSKDHYFNVGARGTFTPKLTGGFTVGYQTRKVDGTPATEDDEDDENVDDGRSDKLLAFDGSLSYELTPKSSLTLGFTRNFNASALGASTKSSSYRLGFTSAPSTQWQIGASLQYFNTEYGKTVFVNDDSILTAGERTDREWQTSVSVTYLITRWLSTSASYLLRKNSSTLDGLDFTANSFSLSVGLRY